MYISSLHRPESSKSCSPVCSFRMKPPMALYTPPTHPLVLNSMSAQRPSSGHRTKLWSPSSYFILPNRIPLAYMFGWVRKLRGVSKPGLGLCPASDSLSLSLGGILAPVQQRQGSRAFHDTSRRVAKEPAPRLDRAVHPDMVFRHHVEVARLWRVVGGLLGDIVGPRLVGQVPVAGEDLAEDRVQRLLDASTETVRNQSVGNSWEGGGGGGADGGRMCQPVR